MSRRTLTKKLVTTDWSAQQVKDELEGLKLLIESPFSEAADKYVDKVVARYNERAVEFVIEADLSFHPRWPAWHRLLQVRFIQLVIDDDVEIRGALQKFLVDRQPEISVIMREVFRQCFMKLIAWGKQNKDKPKSQQLATRPKRADVYWKEAFDSLNRQIAQEVKLGKTIKQSADADYCILGKDYRLRSQAAIPSQ